MNNPLPVAIDEIPLVYEQDRKVYSVVTAGVFAIFDLDITVDKSRNHEGDDGGFVTIKGFSSLKAWIDSEFIATYGYLKTIATAWVHQLKEYIIREIGNVLMVKHNIIMVSVSINAHHHLMYAHSVLIGSDMSNYKQLTSHVGTPGKVKINMCVKEMFHLDLLLGSSGRGVTKYLGSNLRGSDFTILLNYSPDSHSILTHMGSCDSFVLIKDDSYQLNLPEFRWLSSLSNEPLVDTYNYFEVVHTFQEFRRNQESFNYVTAMTDNDAIIHSYGVVPSSDNTAYSCDAEIFGAISLTKHKLAIPNYPSYTALCYGRVIYHIVRAINAQILHFNTRKIKLSDRDTITVKIFSEYGVMTLGGHNYHSTAAALRTLYMEIVHPTSSTRYPTIAEASFEAWSVSRSVVFVEGREAKSLG